MLRRPARFGPLFEQELYRLIRRGTHYSLRYVLAAFLLLAFFTAYPDDVHNISTNEMARIGESILAAVSTVQLIAVWLLTPWFASAVLTEERERKTLDLLLTTTLTSRDIVLGKLAARLLFV